MSWSTVSRWVDVSSLGFICERLHMLLLFNANAMNSATCVRLLLSQSSDVGLWQSVQ